MSDPIPEELSKSNEQNNQLIRSSEVTELIDKKPGFLIRWGVTLLFLAFLLVISATWFIKYPSTIVTKGILNRDSTTGINCFVEAVIPSHRFADIKIGQTVFLKFEAYPHQEFGSVRGRVESIGNSSANGVLSVKISLPNGLITNFKKSFLCRTGLLAEANLIIGNRRLLKIIFEKRKPVISKSDVN